MALTIRYLPGTAGHKPAEGFKPSGPVPPIELPGIVIASFATLSLGVVLGPEAPLIAIGSGLGVLAVHLVKRDAPEMASVVIGAAGSFAAISTLLGSPLPAAFLMMEVAGIGGAMLGVVLAPGLLAAGVGSLIFVGLDDWTGLGTFSLAVPDIPPAGSPRASEFLWAIVIGVIAAILGAGIKRLALLLRPIVERRMVLLTPVVGLAVGVVVLIFVEVTGRSSAEVLFSGQDQLPGLIEGAAGWTVGALLMVVLCKGLAYSFSLSSFRGGPIFPSMFIGAAGGIALSHLPGLPMIAGAAMGIGAMMVAMLGLPLTSVLVVSVFLPADGLTLMPLVIVAVVVYLRRLGPAPACTRHPRPRLVGELGHREGATPSHRTAPVTNSAHSTARVRWWSHGPRTTVTSSPTGHSWTKSSRPSTRSVTRTVVSVRSISRTTFASTCGPCSGEVDQNDVADLEALDREVDRHAPIVGLTSDARASRDVSVTFCDASAMTDTIIVGYDDKEPAKRALDRAIDEAKKRSGRLVVIAVAELPLNPADPRNFGTLDDGSAELGIAGVTRARAGAHRRPRPRRADADRSGVRLGGRRSRPADRRSGHGPRREPDRHRRPPRGLLRPHLRDEHPGRGEEARRLRRDRRRVRTPRRVRFSRPPVENW